MKARDLSEFCMQMSFLLEAGISLDGGLNILAEDASTEQEKLMLINMAKRIEAGVPFAVTLQETEQFPIYIVKMAEVGEATGTLEGIMRSLADYYEKENMLAKLIKNAITYPMIMIVMLLLVLFVLLTKVMPIFESVYQQLGAQLSPITKSAMQIGSVLSGVLLLISLIFAIFIAAALFFKKKGHNLKWTEQILNHIKGRSKIAYLLSKRRLSAILAISIQSGLSVEKGIEMAQDIVREKKIQEMMKECKNEIEKGELLYDALKTAELFGGIDLQMIKVGSQSGKLDQALFKMSQKYEDEVDTAVENMIARFEPTMVAVLGLTVGMILLAVMMPLVGIMATIG